MQQHLGQIRSTHLGLLQPHAQGWGLVATGMLMVRWVLLALLKHLAVFYNLMPRWQDEGRGEGRGGERGAGRGAER